MSPTDDGERKHGQREGGQESEEKSGEVLMEAGRPFDTAKKESQPPTHSLSKWPIGGNGKGSRRAAAFNELLVPTTQGHQLNERWSEGEAECYRRLHSGIFVLWHCL